MKHTPKEILWGCFSSFRVRSFILVEGITNSDKFIDKIERKVILDIKRVFSNGDEIFQQDLAPCHSLRKVKVIFRKYKLKWPGNSPGLNSTENLRAITKSRLQNLDCTSMKKLIEAVFRYGIET